MKLQRLVYLPWWGRLWALVAALACWALPILPLRSRLGDLGAATYLYVGLLVVLWGWQRWVRQESRVWASLGLRRPFWNELLLGEVIAIASFTVLLALEMGLGWLHWQNPPLGALAGHLAWGLLMGLAVALVEELVFRSWLLHEIEQDWGTLAAVGWSSVIFAAVHSWTPQFLGLVVFGGVLAISTLIRQRRLGLSLGLHGGWIAVITMLNSTNALDYPGTVPSWVTGIGGNPAAGLAGIIGLVLVGTGLLFWPLDQADRVG